MEMAGKIYVTGDVHGRAPDRFKIENFPIKDFLDKDDYVIVAGDFGLLWNNGNKEKNARKWLEKQKFTTLFVDGNHENFDMLDNLSTKEWNGGKVGIVSDSILHLKRGNIYTINGKKIFVMGGATSIDKDNRIENISWWRREVPSYREMDFALDNLGKHNWEVDYIITHSAPDIIVENHMRYFKEYDNSLNKFLNLILEETTFKHWYFGHYHLDQSTDKYTMLYNKIIKIK